MKKFKFKFESVEKVRKMRENEALRYLADAQKKLQEAKDHKLRLQRDLLQARMRLEMMGQQPTTPIHFQIEGEYVEGTKHRIMLQDQAIFRAQKGVEKALRNYIVTRRKTRMIEVIREKHHAEFKKALRKHEEKEMAEMYVMRANMEKVMG